MVGVLTIDLALFEARTLKDKRRVIRSVTTKVRNRFNASVAETGYNNSAKRCLLGVAVVSPDSRSVHSQLDKIVDMVRTVNGLTLIEYNRELF